MGKVRFSDDAIIAILIVSATNLVIKRVSKDSQDLSSAPLYSVPPPKLGLVMMFFGGGEGRGGGITWNETKYNKNGPFLYKLTLILAPKCLPR